MNFASYLSIFKSKTFRDAFNKKSFLSVFLVLLVIAVSAQVDTSYEIQQLRRSVDSLIKLQESRKIELLEDRLTQATETISNQDSILSSFGNIYTVITIIIALIGVASPILTYIYGIRPSQIELEKFRKNSEKEFDRFLLNNKKREIATAVGNLENQDIAIRNSAMNYLLFNHHSQMADQQVTKIIELIKSNGFDDSMLNQAYTILSNQKNILIKRFFSELLLERDISPNLDYFALKSFSYYGYDMYRNDVKKYLANRGGKYLNIALLLLRTSKADLFPFFNDKEIVDSLSPDELQAVKASYRNYLDIWKISDNEFNETYIGNVLSNLDGPIIL